MELPTIVLKKRPELMVLGSLDKNQLEGMISMTGRKLKRLLNKGNWKTFQRKFMYNTINH